MMLLTDIGVFDLEIQYADDKFEMLVTIFSHTTAPT